MPDFSVSLTSRQWRLLLQLEADGAGDGLRYATAAADPGDPFAAEVIAFQALEERDRLTIDSMICAGWVSGSVGVGWGGLGWAGGSGRRVRFRARF